MTERDVFLEAILENPRDDTLRLVYADWLEEHGEDASRVRLQRVPADGLGRYTRTRHEWFRYAVALLKGVVPKSWAVWPIQNPFREYSEWPEEGVGYAAWACQQGTTSFVSGRPYFVVGLRHGFVAEVAAPVRRLVKVLPALFARQPVVTVAVTELFLEPEMYLRNDVDDRPGRTIRRRANGIPPAVWDRLTPPVWRDYWDDETRTYPHLTAAYDDLSRAFVDHGRDLARLPPLAAPCPAAGGGA